MEYVSSHIINYQNVSIAFAIIHMLSVQYNSIKNATNRQTACVEPLSVITDVSHSPYGQRISVYILLKTNKIGYIFICS